MASTFSLSADYWKTLEITQQDIDTLHTHLFEIETPLTAHDLTPILIGSRIRLEMDAERKKREAGGKVYLPSAHYVVGDDVVFPVMRLVKRKSNGNSPRAES